MTNLTISLDETIVRQARVRAIQQGTSVSAKVREFLAAYAAGVSQEAPSNSTSELLRLMSQVRAEIQQNESLGATTQSDVDAGAPQVTTLRDEMYQGDFRARARLEASQPSTSAPRS
jgi:plasmid stability protein